MSLMSRNDAKDLRDIMSFENDFKHGNRLINLLLDLKQNYGAVSLKAEFEDEGATFEEVFLLKRFALQAGLDLTVKVGGCGALNDLNQLKKIGASPIVAPMIESSYAFQKFVKNVNSVYSGDIMPEIYINIETITGCHSFEQILSTPESEYLDGVVIGKCDMAKSMGLTCDDVNGSVIFDIVNNLLQKASGYGKKVIIGGGISPASINFLKNLQEGSFHQFETRKVVFDASYAFDKKINEGLIKAIDFEILWLKNKFTFLGMDDETYLQRINTLKKRTEALLLK